MGSDTLTGAFVVVSGARVVGGACVVVVAFGVTGASVTCDDTGASASGKAGGTSGFKSNIGTASGCFCDC